MDRSAKQWVELDREHELQFFRDIEVACRNETEPICRLLAFVLGIERYFLDSYRQRLLLGCERASASSRHVRHVQVHAVKRCLDHEPISLALVWVRHVPQLKHDHAVTESVLLSSLDYVCVPIHPTRLECRDPT